MSSRGTNSSDQAQAARDFHKGACCPPSEELLQFCQHSARIEGKRCAELDRHLAVCDFCSAELYLLAAHAPRGIRIGGCTPVQMPVHLYALARALLAKPRGTHFAEVMHASTALTLTDA